MGENRTRERFGEASRAEGKQGLIRLSPPPAVEMIRLVMGELLLGYWRLSQVLEADSRVKSQSERRLFLSFWGVVAVDYG